MTPNGGGYNRAAIDAFQVPLWMHWSGGLVARHPRFWIRLGNLETRLAAELIRDVPVAAPIYVCGLARSGTTIALELLAAQAGVISHRYRDFPALFTPYAWNRFIDRVPRGAETANERAHGDGIAVTSESPEAFEEMLWMAFFPELHDSGRSSVLDGDVERPDFERFYAEHVRKLLAVRGGQRYLAKGNYNLTRMRYILRLFPDARFVVCVRAPVWHIASLMKQHRLFQAGTRAHPRGLKHLQRIGHYEFGQDRRPIVTDIDQAEKVRALWRDGRELEGWAHYWAGLHGYLADCLKQDPTLRRACQVLRFEDCCAEPKTAVAALFKHAQLDVEPEALAAAAARLQAPSYYRPGFSEAETATIHRITAATAQRFGYQP